MQYHRNGSGRGDATCIDSFRLGDDAYSLVHELSTNHATDDKGKTTLKVTPHPINDYPRWKNFRDPHGFAIDGLF